MCRAPLPLQFGLRCRAGTKKETRRDVSSHSLIAIGFLTIQTKKKGTLVIQSKMDEHLNAQNEKNTYKAVCIAACIHV